jgi:flavodoxin
MPEMRNLYGEKVTERDDHMRRFLAAIALVGILVSSAYCAAAPAKILVVYYSRTGNTERVAKDIAARLNADSEKIIDKKNRSGLSGMFSAGKDAAGKKSADIGPIEKDPANYDLVIVGTPVWAGSMTPAVRSYLQQTKGKFKKAAFFITSGGTGPDKVVPGMEELAGVKAAASAGFTGKELKNEKTYNEKLTAFTAALAQ